MVKMKENKFLKLNFLNTINYYLIVWVPLTLTTINLYSLIKTGIKKEYVNDLSAFERIIIISLFLALTIVLYLRKRNKLLFTKIKVKIPHSEIIEVIKKTAEELEWKITKNKKNL
jgi:hypothetical protein